MRSNYYRIGGLVGIVGIIGLTRSSLSLKFPLVVRYPNLFMSEIFASEWREPGRPDDLLSGTLFEESQSGWVLQLDLSFEQLLGEVPIPGKPYQFFDSVKDYPILCGKASGNFSLCLTVALWRLTQICKVVYKLR